MLQLGYKQYIRIQTTVSNIELVYETPNYLSLQSNLSLFECNSEQLKMF